MLRQRYLQHGGLVCLSNLCVRPRDAAIDQALPDQALDLAPPGPCWSLSFNGTERVVVPNNSTLDLGPFLSIAVWLELSKVAEHLIVVTEKSGQYCGAYGLKTEADNKLHFTVRGGQGSLMKCDPKVDASATAALPVNKWVHVAVIYASTDVTIYVDGSVDSSHVVTPVDPYPLIHDMWLGAEDGPHLEMVGKMSDVQLWSRALSSAEVKAAMAGTVTNKQGLVGNWPLNEGIGVKATDTSGQGNHGQIVNATWSEQAPNCPH